jgi:serine phosphatase RsbU (regulator of sigma subunit)
MVDLLTAVVRATGTAQDSDDLLDRVARTLTSVADWVLADRLDDPDLITRVAAYDASGPLVLAAEVGPTSTRRSSAGSMGLLPAVLASPGHTLRLGRDELERAAAGADARRREQARVALQAGFVDLLVVALVARDVPVGVLTLGSRTPFTEQQLQAVADVAVHVCVALDAARLLGVQREVATVMQTSLLPPVPRIDGLSLAARYIPAVQGLDVGGDWYDAFRVASGLALVIGDVRGHDVAAAARMAELRNLLRALVVDRQEGPASTLARLEQTVSALGLDAAATCVLAVLRPTAGGAHELTWSSAGHLPPVLVHDGRARLLETEADLMLGVSMRSARTEHRLTLVEGDLLVMCTDGLVESRQTSLHERLEVLRRTVEAHARGNPDAVAEALLHELAAAPSDDVALLVIKVG